MRQRPEVGRLAAIVIGALVAVACSSSASAPPAVGSGQSAPAPARSATRRRDRFGGSPRSPDDTVACATCHRPEHAFSEPTPVSTGIGGQQGRRKAPSLVNQADALLPHFFWDGRAGSLVDQALGPIANPIEMGNTPERVVEKLSRIEGYRLYFRAAFGSDEITGERVAQAIVAYEHTRMSGSSPWDRWRYERDESAVSDRAKQGHELFLGKAKCRQCHAGNNFTDTRFHNIGVGWDPIREPFTDEGRFVVTKDEADRGAFKTPALRDVTKHPPYMHDGSVPTLRDAVELYNRGGNRNPYLDVRIEPLGLTEREIDALVAFLESLEGEATRTRRRQNSRSSPEARRIAACPHAPRHTEDRHRGSFGISAARSSSPAAPAGAP